MATRRAPALPTQLDSYVLHRHDWSESSLVLDLFTRERGRIVVVAKGAKRPTSQWRAVLLPFQRVQVQLARATADSQAEVQLLRQAEWVGGGPLLPPAALFQGFYLNELLLRLLARGDAHAAVFDAYSATLPALAHGDEGVAQAGLRAFELLLLRECGFLPDLGVTTQSQQALRAEQVYALRPASGLVVAAQEVAALPGQAWSQIDTALQADDMASLQRACALGLPALKQMLRALLHYHLDERPLRSREVMNSVRRLLDAATSPHRP